MQISRIKLSTSKMLQSNLFEYLLLYYSNTFILIYAIMFSE